MAYWQVFLVLAFLPLQNGRADAHHMVGHTRWWAYAQHQSGFQVGRKKHFGYFKASTGHSSISNDLGALTSVTSSKVVTPFTADEWSQGRPSTITGFQASAAKVLRKSYFFTEVLFCTLDFGGLGEPSGPPGGCPRGLRGVGGWTGCAHGISREGKGVNDA